MSLIGAKGSGTIGDVRPGLAGRSATVCGRDQVEDYARRQGLDLPDVERWLHPNLAYDPA